MLQINIDNYEIISFDIFDTLIKREYLSPKDVFEHLGKIARDASFVKRRIKAEKQARRISKFQDITIDEIYKQLPIEYQKYKETEKQLEINNTFANEEIKSIYDKALKLNKKIIAVSDMYLDKKTILTLLKKAGYLHFDKIYISGEYGKTKWTGDLFDIVIKDLKIDPQKILHIGDNYKSDYKIACKKGIDAFYYQEKTFLKDKKFTKFSLSSKELEKSVLFSLCNRYYKETDDYFKKFGFTYGGPLCLSFINWFYPILKEQKFSDVLFISRDGWILKKVFDILYPNSEIKPHYIYASREICKNVDFQEYKKYLEKQNIVGKKIATVDTIGYNYTAQRFLQQFFKYKIMGLYFRRAKINKDIEAIEFETKFKIILWDFMEFIITAPEYPAKNIKNDKIIFEKNNIFEETRRNIYLKISQGIIDFIEEFRKIYQYEYLQMNNSFSVCWMNNFFFYLTKEDMTSLSSVYCTINHDEQYYFNLIPKRYYFILKVLSFLPYTYLWTNFFLYDVKFANIIRIIKRKLRKHL